MEVEILIIAVGVLSVVAKLVGTYLKERVAAQPLKLKITSPSGESLIIQLKAHMSREENAEIVRSLELLEQQQTRSST